ncbi:hypothetical protein AMTR_s03806p00005440 [Amborella trichopoda]|uniref:Uncharacterized protein n=1 Tax=Amborella trichopoda TaxID=13333 RepID=U5CX70_AMBTC|nr:hypothetical protein AMTR_s03806p00005440 [Amborella trichopoda]
MAIWTLALHRPILQPHQTTTQEGGVAVSFQIVDTVAVAMVVVVVMVVVKAMVNSKTITITLEINKVIVPAYLAKYAIVWASQSSNVGNALTMHFNLIRV